MKKGIIYCRVSTTKQEKNGESLDNQEKACRKYCENNDIQIFGVYKEAYTGKKRERPIFNEAITTSKLNNVDYFIIFDIDRFSREGYSIYSNIKEELSENGIQLKDSKNIIGEDEIVIKNDIFDMSEYKWNKHNRSEMAEMVYSAQAKIEGDKIIQRTIPREIELEQQGYQVRQANYGFMNKKIKCSDGKKKTIQVPDPIESEWVKEIFINRAKGHLTDKQIIDNINLKGCVKRTGKVMDVKYMQEQIVKPVYAGIISTKWTGKKAIRTPYEGIVDIETWNNANRGKMKIIEIDNKEVKIEYNNGKNIINETPIIEKRKDYNPDYAFSKVLKCPICDGDLTPNTSKSGNGTLHHYYQCRGKNGVKHKNYTVKREDSHNKIIETFKSIEIKDDILDIFDEISAEVFKEKAIEEQKNSISYEKQLIELDKEENNILNDIDKVINFPLILERKNNRLEEIKSQKYKLEIERKKAKNDTSLDKFRYYSKNIITHLEQLALQKDKPEYISIAFDVVFEGRVEYENLSYHTNFFHSFSPNLSHKKNPSSDEFSLFSKWQAH